MWGGDIEKPKGDDDDRDDDERGDEDDATTSCCGHLVSRASIALRVGQG